MSDDQWLWIKAIIKTVVLPPTGLLLLTVIGLAIRKKFPRGGVALAWTSVVILFAMSTTIVADLMTLSVATTRPFAIADARDANAIVILGGGIRSNAPEYGGDTLGILTLERVRYGARIARLTGLPVLVSGGIVLGGAPEAALMRDALEGEFGVRVRWVESKSRTTHENAVLSADVLRREEIRRVVLVAHAVDMRRATAEFAAAGVQTIPAPTRIPVEGSYSVLDLLPSMSGLQQSYWATYEILANVVRVASGR